MSGNSSDTVREDQTLGTPMIDHPNVKSIAKESGLAPNPVGLAADLVSFATVPVLVARLEKRIQRYCGISEKSKSREAVATLDFEQMRLHDLIDVWAKNYYRYRDPVSVMDKLDRCDKLIDSLLEQYEDWDEEGLVQTVYYSGEDSDALSDCSTEREVKERKRSEWLKGCEHKVRCGIRSRELAYGDASWDLEIFGLRLDQQVRPKWFGEEGFEEMTARWVEQDAQARKEIIDFEENISKGYKRDIIEPKTSHNHAWSRHNCTCGQSCLTRHAAELRAGKYVKRSLKEAELMAERSAERSKAEQARFICKNKGFVQCLECRLDDGELIDLGLRVILREILSHSKGRRDDEQYEDMDIDPRSIPGPVASLKYYCIWLRNNPQVEVDAELAESAQRVLDRAATMSQMYLEVLHLDDPVDIARNDKILILALTQSDGSTHFQRKELCGRQYSQDDSGRITAESGKVFKPVKGYCTRCELYAPCAHLRESNDGEAAYLLIQDDVAVKDAYGIIGVKGFTFSPEDAAANNNDDSLIFYEEVSLYNA